MLISLERFFYCVLFLRLNLHFCDACSFFTLVTLSVQFMLLLLLFKRNPKQIFNALFCSQTAFQFLEFQKFIKKNLTKIKCILYCLFEPMSCKETFSLFDFGDENYNTPLPLPFNDELLSISSIEQQQTPQTNFDILLNKHLNNHEITDVELQQLPEHQRNVLAQIQSKGKEKKKRPDQCQKLFYKRAFKYSQSKFFKRCKNKSRKMSHFYHFHFDHISKKQGVPITQFYHPNKKTKPGLLIGYKTFNSQYVRLLLKSKSFLEDTKQYHKIFIDDCIRQRQRKINSFTNSLQRIMERAQEDTRIIVKHLQSSQCKIPWTDGQIKDTWEYAQRDLEEVEDAMGPDELEMMKKANQYVEEISLGQESS